MIVVDKQTSEVRKLPKRHTCGDCGTKHKIRKWAVLQLKYGGTAYAANHYCDCGAGVLSFLVSGQHDDEELLESIDAFMQTQKR